jgi:hypothetical protein
MVAEDFIPGKLYMAKKEFAVWNQNIMIKPNEVFVIIEAGFGDNIMSMEILLPNGTVGKVLANLDFLQDMIGRVES